MPDPTTITVTTANICGNPLRLKRFVRRRMRRALSRHGVTFGQEVARSNRWRRGNYSAMWRAVAGVYGKSTFGGPHEVPISVPDGWEVAGARTVLVHRGRARVSPARYITEVRCVVGGRLVAFLNCHPVSKPRRGVPAASWRIKRWAAYHRRLRAMTSNLHGRGYTVVVGGDMNKRAPAIPKIHPAQMSLIHSGLDHLWVVPADGVRVRVTHRSKVGRTALMDHPILTATLEIT